MCRPLGRAWRLVYPPLAAAGAAGCAGPLARRSLGAGSLCARASSRHIVGIRLPALRACKTTVAVQPLRCKIPFLRHPPSKGLYLSRSFRQKTKAFASSASAQIFKSIKEKIKKFFGGGGRK